MPATILTFNPQSRQSSRRVDRRSNPFTVAAEEVPGFHAIEWLGAYHRAVEAGRPEAQAIAAADNAAPRELWAVEMVG